MADNKIIRFDIDLEDSDYDALESMMDISHRSRKNLCEALILLAIKVHKENNAIIDLKLLGIVKKKIK